MCSYCGCEAITIIGRFMAEHTEIRNALTRLRAGCTARDAEEVVGAATIMRELLHPHTVSEEVGLFAVMREDDLFTDHIESLCAEHASLDDLLERIAAGAHDRYPEFEHTLQHHIDREDNGLFPAAHIAMSGPDWERIDELTPPPPDPCGQLEYRARYEWPV